jgi:hypothetical protein
MNVKPTPSDDQLARLRDELVADVMKTTDEQILEETRLRGIDPAAAAEHVRSLILEAIVKSGKQRMQEARASLQASKQARSVQSPVIDIQRARALLNIAAANDPELQQRLTLAARNGEGLSDRDIQDLVEDLRALGVLPDWDADK